MVDGTGGYSIGGVGAVLGSKLRIRLCRITYHFSIRFISEAVGSQSQVRWWAGPSTVHGPGSNADETTKYPTTITAITARATTIVNPNQNLALGVT